MPATIKTWWWGLKILTLFPFSVLYSPLNRMQNKHLLVINMAFSVKMTCTQMLRKITWMEMMFTWSCVFKPQSSHVFKWTYNALNMWQIQKKPRIWLSITWNHFYIPKQIGWYTTIGFGVDVLALKPKSNHLHLLETCYTGQQSLSTYCCTHQSLNHNLSKIQNLFPNVYQNDDDLQWPRNVFNLL